MNDPFRDGQNRPRVLRGVTILSAAPRLAELAGRVGFETVWIEVEHGPVSFTEAEVLCMAAEAGGAVPTVRVPDYQRHHILRALEVGARILVVPMIENADAARRIVEYGKFPPVGLRGYNTRSRGVEYGLQDCEAAFRRANERTHLFAQIEAVAAVRNLDSILGVPGLAGIFIGPGDLSASMGRVGRLDDAELITMVTDCIRRARTAGRHAGILVPPGPMLDAAVAAGGDLVFCASDIGDLSKTWRALLPSIPCTSFEA